MFTGHEDARDENKVYAEKPKVVENHDSLYLNEKFSDITFLVGGEKLPAHKAILSTKSKGFENLFDANPEKREITMSKTSPEAFRLLLKYMYTDIITIPSDVELFLQELILSHQYSVKQVKTVMMEKINTIVNVKNVCFFFNGANTEDVDELRDACHSFMDDNALEILSSDGFNNLTQKSLIEILKRDTFAAAEIEIFKSVAKWCEKNNNADNLVLQCVRLSLLTVSEIVSIVWPTKLVKPEKIIETISEIVGNDSKNLCRRPRVTSKLVMDKNIATVESGAKVISPKVDATALLTGNRDVNKNVQHTIDGENGIIISLRGPHTINHIHMMLYDADKQYYYSYYIETSLDRNKWHRIVDYSGYSCRSFQNLYFNEQVAHYIKIVGTSSSGGTDFQLVFFEAFYKSKIPKTRNAVIYPETNVATPENGAMVIEGTSSVSKDPQFLLNGEYRGGLTSHKIGDSKGIIVQLAQPYVISSMRLLLFTDSHNAWKYKYFIETSINGADWEIVIDRRNEECQRWQDLHFAERVVVFIKLTGTYSTHYDLFHCGHFECPSQGKK